MTVDSVMTREVIAVGMDDSIATIRGILEAANFHHLLVVDRHRKLVGVLSDRDVLRVISPFLGSLSETRRDVTILQRRVHQIMTRDPITVGAEVELTAAMRRLIDHDISCLPVVAADGRIEGIVTWRDLLRAQLNHVA